MAVEQSACMPDERVIRRAEADGLKLALRLRLAMVVLVVLALLLALPLDAALELGAVAVLWGVLGGLYYLLGASPLGRGWAGYPFAVLDALLLVGATVLLVPQVVTAWPEQMVFRLGAAGALVVLLALYGLSASPALLVWTGLASVTAWAAGIAWVAALPTTLSVLIDPALAAGASQSDLVALFLDPQYLPTWPRLAELGTLAFLAGTLALMVRQSRRVMAREIRAARTRGHLERHLGPARTAAAAEGESPLEPPRDAEVAVLAAGLAEVDRSVRRHAPGDVVATLREFRARAEDAVFEHGGCVVGVADGGVTAAFGALEGGTRAAANALACARAVLIEAERWNEARERAGEPPLRLSLGIHAGWVVVGDVGAEGRPELAVLGDAVGLAHWLATLAGDLAGHLVVSDGVLRAVRSELGQDADALLAGLAARGVQRRVGRDTSVAVWAL